MPASPEAICYRYSLQHHLSPGHHAELQTTAWASWIQRAKTSAKQQPTSLYKTLRPCPSSTFAFISLRNRNSQPCHKNAPSSSFFHVEGKKKKTFKEENMDSLKKEGEVAGSHSQAKLQLHQGGFDLSSQALAMSSLSPHPITLAVTSSSLKTSLRKLSQISQLQQHDQPFSSPLQ